VLFRSMLNMVKKSLQLELDSFFEKVLDKGFSVTKQAYHEARQKIKPEIFIEMNNYLCRMAYQEAEDGYERWNGYRLSAIDGSVLQLPDTIELREAFGCIKNQNAEVARASAACIYDVVNKIVLQSKIDRYDVSEKVIAQALINELLQDRKDKECILFDRGYPSAELIAYLFERQIDFVMRAKRNFSNDVMKAKNEDQVILINYNKKSYKVRVVRLMLESGQEEILLTSLLDGKFTVTVLKELYFKRWGIETKYDELKNRLEIENFTGTNKVAIEQDFYASIYVSNMIELVRAQKNDNIKEKNKLKGLKYEYKTNLSILTGVFKDKFVRMLLEDSPKKREKIFDSIMKQISKCVIPIRPERKNERKVCTTRGKFKTNYKRCL
jgi:hypothetical protein